MSALTIICFFIAAAASVAVGELIDVDFYRLPCGRLSADLFPVTRPSLQKAAEYCARNGYCIGFRKLPDGRFMMLWQPLTNATTANFCGDYIFDKSNRTSFKGAPSALDIKLVFQIYWAGTSAKPVCTILTTEVNGRCESAHTGSRAEDLCKSYPAYMMPSVNPLTGKCSVIRFQDLLTLWA